LLHVLPNPVPWYIVGPLMGLVVAAMYAVTNRHLGVSGSYVQLVDAARHRSIEVWRLWFLGGIFIGGALVALLGESPQAGLNYGILSQHISLGALIPILFLGGCMVGIGARWAGACTSGHGLTGCSTRSTGSMTAMATFMVTAVGVTWLLHLLTGGSI
jgi:uncharacterized membrane protein YedE/YeeE